MFKKLSLVFVWLTLSGNTYLSQTKGSDLDPNLFYDNQTWGWIGEPWTGDNSVYLKIATNIHRQIAAGKNLEKAWDDYRQEATKNPKDPRLQFSRAYFLVQMDWGKRIQLLKRGTGSSSELLRAWQGLLKAPSPRCREYSRIRFLINSKEAPQLELIPLGKRLSDSNKDDLLSKHHYARLLTYSKDKLKIRNALDIANEIKALRPKEPSSFSLLGDCYIALWHLEHNKVNAKLAIDNYQKAVVLSKDQAWNRWATGTIEFLRREVKKTVG